MTTRSPRASPSALCLRLARPGRSRRAIEPVAPARARSSSRPYLRAGQCRPSRLANSARLRELIRAGMLYLTAQDAIALALENNIDIEVARYNPHPGDVAAGARRSGRRAARRAQRRIAGRLGRERARASRAARLRREYRIAGGGNHKRRRTNATISQIGPVTQTLDPIDSGSHHLQPHHHPAARHRAEHHSTADPRTRASTPVTYQQGFLTGGSVTVNLQRQLPERELAHRSAESVRRRRRSRRPSQHNLLRGFGVAVECPHHHGGADEPEYLRLNFKTQVTAVVTPGAERCTTTWRRTTKIVKAKQ